ncbi:S8 family serine peptidase [Acidobacteriota bacterium]
MDSRYKKSGVNRNFICSILVLCLLNSFCGQSEREDDWARHVFEEGKEAFFRAVDTEISTHPERNQLTDEEIMKVRTLERQFPRAYGILINLYYQKEEPVFRTLLKHQSDESRDRFRKLFLKLAEFSAHNFVKSLFLPGLHPDFIRNIQPRFKDKDRVDLILLSMGYFAKLDIPEKENIAPPLSPEFDRQWGLDAANFRTAHQISKGKGARIAIIDSGIDTNHPIFKKTYFGEHFALVGRAGPPWSSNSPVVDWGWHGTIVSSIAARYAPEAQITLFKGMDADTMNDAPYPLILAHFMAASIYKAVHDGNDIINISAGLGKDFSYVKEACQYAYDNNVIIVTASPYYLGKYLGNNYSFPGSYDSTISVTGIEKKEDGSYGYWPIAAPEVTTTVGAPCAPFVAYPTYVEEKDDYAPGISCATPIVAAAVALAVSQYPRLGTEKPGEYFETIKKLLTDTARPESCGFQGFTPECGYGLIDAEHMVLGAQKLHEKLRKD